MGKFGSILLWVLAASVSFGAERLVLHVQYPPGTKDVVVLRGPDARQQLLATLATDGGTESDVTGSVGYESTPAKVVQVEKHGLVTPIGNGTASVTAKSTNGLTATIQVRVEHFA